MISDNKEHDNPDASDLYDAYPDAVLMLAPDGRILHANRSAEERYGYSREQLMLMNVAELAAANLNDQILTHLHPALNSAIRFESKLRCQDGSELAVDIFARPIDYRGEKATIAGVRDITELRRIELSQRESEDKLRLFINYAPSAIAMFDRDMRYIVHSHRWLVDYHLPEQDLIGRSHYEIFPELPERWKQIHTSSLAGTVEKCDEDPFPRADGSVDWVHWETRPWRTSDGDIGGIIIFSEVITERKQAEMKLRESEGRFRVLFEQAGVGVAQINTITGQFVRINQKYSDIVGYSRAEMEQLDFHKITHPDDLPADLHNMELLKAGRKTEFTMEKRYFHKNGSLVWVTLTVSPMWSAGEPPSFHVAVVEDISERKQAEKALIESERRYRQLFENMSSGFVLYEVIQNDQGVPVDLQIIAANAKYEQTTGLSIEHVVGKRLTHVLPGIEDDAADWIGIFGKVALTGDAMQFEHDSELLGFYYNISAYQAGPKQCAVNFLDITGRRQAEKALEKSRKLLAETEQIGKVGGWEFNIDTGKQTWTEEIYHIHELAIDYDPSLEEGINFYTPESRPIIEQAVQRVIEHAEPFDLELEIITAKGNLRNVHAIGKADLEQRRVYGFFQDITDAKQAEKHIEQLAHFDQLTGLPNRNLLSDRFKYALSRAQRNNEPLAVMFLDLDSFKNVNDTLGHTVGDELLIEVAKRINATLRDEDTVSRQGGDEFMLILHATDGDGAANVAAKLIEVISQPCLIGQYELTTTASIGIAIYPHDGNDIETLCKNVDAAMYRSKQEGRNMFRFFTPEMQAHSARTLQLAHALRYALARNELTLHYQPQFSMQAEHNIGAEALLRWQHPELGMISPAEFIPIAEDGGHIIAIGEWVLRTAARQLKDWLDAGLPPMVMAVNLSSVQFRQTNISQLITRILDDVGLAPAYLELELTEAVAMDDPLGAIGVMDKLHERGIHMSIDDFGTGYSSLSYLKKFKVYKLKIDQSFVRDISVDPDDKAIVSAIINMASSLGIKTIAEGVETTEQLEFLRLNGCDEVQGYYFSKPIPADQFEAFVKNR